MMRLARLRWRRLVNPARRLGVTLQYDGAAAALDLFRERLRAVQATEMPPPSAAAASFDTLTGLATAPPVRLRTPLVGAPAVSAVVRTHNRPALLEQALVSLANQTYSDFEVLVVNDGTLDVQDVLERLDPYVHLRLADHTAGSGRMAALNSGQNAARGRWITYLDDDDVIYPSHLERLAAALTGGEASVAYSDATRTLCWSDAQRDEPVLRLACPSLDFDMGRLLVDNWIASVAFMHAAECSQVIGGFDESLEHFEDWDYLIRLGQACTFRHVPVVTFDYRHRFGPVPEGSRSAYATRKRERILECTRDMYARYPTASPELKARRRLTLAALEQDIEEVSLIEATVANPLLRDLLVTARVGRFPVSRQLAQQFSSPL